MAFIKKSGYRVEGEPVNPVPPRQRPQAVPRSTGDRMRVLWASTQDAIDEIKRLQAALEWIARRPCRSELEGALPCPQTDIAEWCSACYARITLDDTDTVRDP